MKNRQGLHEIIRASCPYIIFVELFFKPVYPTMVVKNFKFMENYNSWKMYFQVKILTLDIFTHMLPPPILKFGIKYVFKPLTLNCYALFILIFHAGLRGLGSYNFGNSSYKEKTAVRPAFSVYLPVMTMKSLNFKTSCCNLKIRSLGAKLCVAFLLF